MVRDSLTIIVIIVFGIFSFTEQTTIDEVSGTINELVNLSLLFCITKLSMYNNLSLKLTF